jgi:bis(5'-adenosyl)-triphosphatase
VPHVHIHLIPRHPTDYGGDNDQIYPALEKSEQELKSELQSEQKPSSKQEWQGVKDEDRKARTMEVMEDEAKWLAGLFAGAG